MLRALFLLFTLTPAIGFAEVSDKMATISELWLQGLIVGAILFALVRWSHWYSVLAAVVVIFFFIASQKTFTDPYIGPAIMQEQGNRYKVASYGSVCLMLFGILSGLFINRRRRKNAS